RLRRSGPSAGPRGPASSPRAGWRPSPSDRPGAERARRRPRTHAASAEDLIRADSDHGVYTCAAGTQVTRVPTTSTSLSQGGGCQMNLQPLGDRLIVEVLEEEETTASGIVLPDTAKEKPQRGRVLAVGPGPRDEDGEHIAMDLEEGDEVIFSKYGGTEIKLGTDGVFILRSSDVLAQGSGGRPAGGGNGETEHAASKCGE